MGNTIGFFAVQMYVQCILTPALVLYALLTNKMSAYLCVRHICNVLGVKYLRTKSSKALQPGCLYLCNHRSWADFFVDQVLCGGAAYLSRMMVILGVPGSSLWAWLGHSTWYFNRKSGIDRSAFGRFLEEQWQGRPEFGLVAYPEGTRNLSNEPKKLKTGVLQYAYEYKHPVQSVITTNKEKVVNEKKFAVNFNQFVVTHYSKVLDPKDFEDKDAFIAAVREQFAESWKEANCDPKECTIYDPPFGLDKPSMSCKPYKNRANIVRVIILLILVALLYLKSAKTQ